MGIRQHNSMPPECPYTLGGICGGLIFSQAKLVDVTIAQNMLLLSDGTINLEDRETFNLVLRQIKESGQCV